MFSGQIIFSFAAALMMGLQVALLGSNVAATVMAPSSAQLGCSLLDRKQRAGYGIGKNRQWRGQASSSVSSGEVLLDAAVGALGAVDPWAPGGVDSQSLASTLFAASLFPYLGFLYHLTKSKSAPKLTLFGFYFLLAFVGATIPAGIYAKLHYGTSLSNVDWLHGGAESLLTATNLFIVLGLRKALRAAKDDKPVASSNDTKLPL